MSLLAKQMNQSPVIAAIKDQSKARIACSSSVEIVFILGCNICTLPDIVDMLRSHDKTIFVHMDMVDGLGKDQWAIEYLSKTVHPHGIISTRPNLIKYASEHKLMTVQRLFLLDSASIRTGIELARKSKADFIELVPGVIPKAIQSVKRHINQPIIVGGMVTKENEIQRAIRAGAVGVSTSNTELWHSQHTKELSS